MKTHGNIEELCYKKSIVIFNKLKSNLKEEITSSS